MIDQKDPDENRLYKNYKWKRNQNFIIDGLLYLLDLSMFIIDFKPKQKEDALALIEESIKIASLNDLNKHYTSVYATELYFQHYVYDVFEDQLCKYNLSICKKNNLLSFHVVSLNI
jgi:hypothetical protein